MKILITGLPGSGKTTQARRLATELGISLISTGAMMRSLMVIENDLGDQIRRALESGEMVYDQIVANVLEKRLRQKDCQKGFVMDGYPRSENQLKYFDPHFDKIFYLKISEEEVQKRLLHRGREDDLPEVIIRRIQLHKQAIEALRPYFQANAGYVEIDGEQPAEQIYQQILAHIKE